MSHASGRPPFARPAPHQSTRFPSFAPTTPPLPPVLNNDPLDYNRGARIGYGAFFYLLHSGQAPSRLADRASRFRIPGKRSRGDEARSGIGRPGRAGKRISRRERNRYLAVKLFSSTANLASPETLEMSQQLGWHVLINAKRDDAPGGTWSPARPTHYRRGCLHCSRG